MLCGSTVLKRPEEHREKLSQLVVFFSSWEVAMLLSNLPRKLNQFEHVNRFQYTSSCHRCFKESVAHTHWSTIVFIVHAWPWSISSQTNILYNIHILGGFNPFEKHISQTGSFPQVGVNMNVSQPPHPAYIYIYHKNTRNLCPKRYNVTRVMTSKCIMWSIPPSWGISPEANCSQVKTCRTGCSGQHLPSIVWGLENHRNRATVQTACFFFFAGGGGSL